MRKDYADVVRALRRATLERDADRLLVGIGKNKIPEYIFKTAAAFPDAIYGDRETILNSVAKGSLYHLKSALLDLRNKEYVGIDPSITLDRIIFGITGGEHERIASYLKSEGLSDEAHRVLELKDEPPF
jgi:hypothetical protein